MYYSRAFWISSELELQAGDLTSTVGSLAGQAEDAAAVGVRRGDFLAVTPFTETTGEML